MFIYLVNDILLTKLMTSYWFDPSLLNKLVPESDFTIKVEWVEENRSEFEIFEVKYLKLNALR